MLVKNYLNFGDNKENINFWLYLSLNIYTKHSRRRLISMPSAKSAILQMAVTQKPVTILTKPFFSLSSMGSTTNTDNIFSFLRQIVF